MEEFHISKIPRKILDRIVGVISDRVIEKIPGKIHIRIY